MGSPLEIANQQRRLPMISFINDPKELKGRRTLVTGGSRGIGGAIVIETPNFGSWHGRGRRFDPDQLHQSNCRRIKQRGLQLRFSCSCSESVFHAVRTDASPA
jgi:NAD(P)-dependent dehydrogenase (short-subunit alcohol dehydrogenase family)